MPTIASSNNPTSKSWDEFEDIALSAANGYALRRSISEPTKASKLAKKLRKAASGQQEML
jgi:hypothetical protein